MKKTLQLLAVAGLISSVCGAAHADLVTNGGFELTNYNMSGQLGVNYGSGAYALTGWTNGNPYGNPADSYAFIFTPGTADTTGVQSQNGTLKLWGPNDGSANGLSATSPLGGNFLASDGAYQPGPISQVINGLVIGQSYTLSFDWAAAQQFGFDGPTQSGWTVGFGTSTFDTGVAAIGNHGFSGWQVATTTFTATSTSQTLSFLAHGTPAGLPPFSLLDGVSLNASTTPEGSTMGLLSVGLLSMGGVSAFVRRRKAKAENAA